jgi:hypothetical protein
LLLNGFRYGERSVLPENAGKGEYQAGKKEESKSFSHEEYF